MKTHGFGFEVPYVHEGDECRYVPDFIVGMEDEGPRLLNLIVDIRGFRRRVAQAKADTMKSQWAPAVNNYGGLGRWAFLDIRDIYDGETAVREYVTSLVTKLAAE